MGVASGMTVDGVDKRRSSFQRSFLLLLSKETQNSATYASTVEKKKWDSDASISDEGHSFFNSLLNLVLPKMESQVYTDIELQSYRAKELQSYRATELLSYRAIEL